MTVHSVELYPSTTPPRVLIADADDAARAAYRQSFARAGCDVVEAADGREALVRALVREPGLILSDLFLPLLDGFALCEILRRDRMTENVPILIVTTNPQAAVVDKARAVGADAVFRKSANLAPLMKEAARLLERSQLLRTRSVALSKRVVEQLDKTRAVREEVAAVARLSRSHQRFATSTPPSHPPELVCPSCDQPLAYEFSYVGGVSVRYPEQWDYFRCSQCDSRFQYRQRTRKLRSMP